jgi:endonuclease/exonuclease/phosphatase family metal-dependent hydrolase
MRHKLFILVLTGMFLLQIGCNKELPFSPQSEAKLESQDLESQGLLLSDQLGLENITVMTRNIYVGTNVDAVLGAQSPEEVPVLVAQAFQTLLSTDFRERAQTLADEIEQNSPHLIGLQEVSTIRTQSPGDAVIGGTTPAENVLFDYLAILMEALQARGLHYRVAGITQNADVEVPMVVNVSPLAFDDVRLTDYDVVLARQDVQTSDVAQVNYQARLVVPSFGAVIPRGYVALDAKIGCNRIRFVNTHLEPASIPELLPIQMGQAQELVASLQNESLPSIVVGDLNTEALTGDTYQFLAGQGYVDVWTQKRNRDEGAGNTCCHDPDLRNTTVHLDQRIDLILAKGNGASADRFSKGATVRVVGDELRDRTPSGLWPSDHAGVVARFGMLNQHDDALTMAAAE